MYSKNLLAATLLLAACSLHVPWKDEPVGQEVNVAFTLRKNLVVLSSVTIDGRPGVFLLGTAEQRTLLDAGYAPALPPSSPHALRLNQREALQFTPVVADLHGVGDAIVGADVWGRNSIAIDYRIGIVTFSRLGVERAQMTVFHFAAEPMINVSVDGHTVAAAVDTASPDTLVLPRGNAPAGRRAAHVIVGATDFGNVDVLFADVTQARVGNRLLSKFLVAIDYGRKQVGLWRDPRTSL
ncbi:MAG TPA: hypothetical protein VJZ76_15495 [Thermoanaerobaculia bacterium]|nr:hypothetical protein [Thermoanaerobaculia bacterium]